MFCTSCGKIINDDSVFCLYCGSKVTPVKPSEPVSVAKGVSSDDEEREPQVEFSDLTPSETNDSEREAAEQTDDASTEPDEGPSLLPIGHDDDSSDTRPFMHLEREMRHAHDADSDKTLRHVHRERESRRHGRPVSGLTKATLALLVVWTAVIGIIMVRQALTSQNARETAMATGTLGKDGAAGRGSTQTEEGNSGRGQTEVSTEASDTASTENSEPEKLTFKCLFKNAVDWSQINQITAFLSPGKDAPTTDSAYQLLVTGDGHVVSEAAEGDYTLSWHADGYYDGFVNVTIGKSVLTMEKNLIPVLTDPRNCTIMLEWNGDRDLDLVLFDAHTRQYVNILNPIEAGNFLFQDETANRRCEVIRIADCTLPQVYTVYVRDDLLLRNIASESTISMMERDGVSVTVATAAGIIAYKQANKDSTSALWCPLYVYEGNAYPMDNYITDYTNEAWAFYDKTVK